MRLTLIRSNQANGFTIVEILTVITVIGILIPIVMGTLADFYTANGDTMVKTIQNGDNQTALRMIEKDVVTAERFLTANAIPDPGSGTSWTYGGPTNSAQNRRLILSTYATTITPETDSSGNRTLLFSGATCSDAVMNNRVYFVSNGSLYRRTIKNTVTPCTGTVAQKQTCAAGNAASGCTTGGLDAVLLRDVTAFSINYYQTPASSTVYSGQYTAAGQATIESPSTKAIEVSITTTRKSNGKDSTITSKIRLARQN